jgi:hypothetical protein
MSNARLTEQTVSNRPRQPHHRSRILQIEILPYILNTMRRLAWFLGFCGTALAATPTFYKDVAPILNAHCAQCHRPGQVAPMSLIRYEQTRPWAAAIKEAVVMRKMPPWPASGPVGHFSNDWRLTPEQIAILRQWAEGHAPKGDPKEASASAHEFTDNWEKGAPDIVLSLPHEQKLAGNGTDLWKWILFDKTFDEDTCILCL